MPEIATYHFPKKVYLTGSDCFHLVLDLHAKKHGAGGNVMRKVFYFRHRINEDKFKATLLQSPAIHWLCNIKLHRGIMLALPYWKYKNEGRHINIRIHNIEQSNFIPEEILNRDIPVGAASYVEADLLRYASGESAFILSWNHILLDAKGSALLFEHLNRIAEGFKDSTTIFFPDKEKGTGIWGYIRNMYKVKAFIQNSSRKPVSSVSFKNPKTGKVYPQNLIVKFTESETLQIEKAGMDAGSKFGPTHFYLSCCAHIMHRLNQQRGNPGPLWVPVPYDGRLKGGSGPLFSNNVSFIFYRIEQEHLTTVSLTVSELARQMTDQIRIGMPKKYNLLLAMMRHLPLWMYYFLINNTGEGTLASFLYTSAGENFNQMFSLCGERVCGLGMVTALTFPPGFTFVFLKHSNCLSLNFSYLPGVISNAELNFVITGIKELLLNR